MNDKNITVKLYGDSIMRGVLYDAPTDHYNLRKPMDFKHIAGGENMDISCDARMGATSVKGLELVSRDIAANPDARYIFTLLEFGANDADYLWNEIAAAPDASHSTKVSEEKFISNMKEMISLVRPRTDIVALSTLAPFDTDKYFIWLSRGLDDEAILRWLGGKENLQNSYCRYDEIVRWLAEEEDCPLFDLRAVLSQNGDITCDDGVHPCIAGYDIMDEALVRFIQKNHNT